ncbi:MAG TPA: hypothetical protein VGL99_22195 [Chloroflexota bacterium]|jgi:hypothetical protein
MLSPLDFDVHVLHHQAELLRQAEAVRLADQALSGQRGVGVRPRLAAVLHALADRLEARPAHSAQLHTQSLSSP